MKNWLNIPKRGRYQLKYRGVECLNCGHPLKLNDKFCPNCSQANSTKKLSLNDFFSEFFANYLSYDSRFLRTLSTLLIRPGQITKDYINGKRVSYTNPFRFLLSLSIIYFLMINYGGNYNSFDKYGAETKKDVLTRLDLLEPNSQDNSFSALDSITQSTGVKQLIDKIKKQDSIIMLDPEAHFRSLSSTAFLPRIAEKQDFFETLIINDTIYDLAQASRKYDIPDNLENTISFNFAKGITKFRQQPGSFISNLISRLPFATFFFLPVFALFIWLAYARKKYNYTDHLIFGFHNMSLLFILLIISHFTEKIFSVNSNWIFLTIFSVYLFYAMKKFYGEGISKTIVKYLFLNAIFFILAAFSILVLVAGNIITY
ncbi:DUF3667 domain-containing protein [Kriegella aquimaris]|uniref:DUF3667 domain-containing protein n=1 Tax=Kriegella aquimaris TaxID=192904 RepID=A0A1G9PIG4_9FLAO|nr:DUF3667 domain-containing protein [Kriegella aquimaris]SDL98570.1 Protein of unknown function [Kriegella aquimaris]